MRMRVEELALEGAVSVDTVRYYQKQGILPPPERDGRLGWYTSAHLERLTRIKDLQRRGFSLALIRRFLAGELEPSDEGLAAAVAGVGPASSPTDSGAEHDAHGSGPAADDGEAFTLEELAARSQVPAGLLEMLVKESILVPRRIGGHDRFTSADARAVAAGLAVLELGFPLAELIDLARRHDAATRQFAVRAVDLFDEHVRTPLQSADLDDDERSRQLVDAFETLLPAVTTMVSHHFRRTLLAVATEHLEKVGERADVAELAAARIA